MGKYVEALVGAGTAGIIDAAIEMNVDKIFPGQANVPLFGVEPLPPVDDWAVLGLSFIPILLGRYALKKNKYGVAVENFGFGMVAYSTGMILHHVVVRASRMTPAQAGYTVKRDVSYSGYTVTGQTVKGNIPVNIYFARGPLPNRDFDPQ